MKTRAFKGWLVSALLCISMPTLAEDIDLFVGVPSDTDGDLPNVLFVVDNTANWNTSFANLKSALSNTFLGLPENKFRVGIMFFNETGNPNSNVAGGYVRAAIRTMDSTTKPLYANLITGLDEGADKGNGAIGSLVMAEAWHYYMGNPPYAGTEKEKTDYTGNALADPTKSTGLYAASRAVWALPKNALDSFKSDPRYNSPLSEGSCARNFIIYLSNGASTDNTSVIKESNAQLKIAGGSAATTTIPLNNAGLQGNPIDEWARFMKNSVLGITTYTIDINPATNGQGPNWTSVLQSMANVGGGKYFAVSSADGGAEIANTINTVLSEIQSVNSVYASVSLPVSVNTQGYYLNQMFIGMFRPAQNALPRWDGNLKQYKIGFPAGTTVLTTLDADNQAAINASTGFIAECARSFWTPTTADSYWSNITEQQCLSSSATGASNTPDGNLVEKGGQGYMLRAMDPDDRNVYYQDNTGALAPLTAASLTAAQVGASSASERDLLVNWISGYNNRADDAQDNFVTNSAAMRPSAHGDVVHSRPVAINFGTDAEPDVTVFYGANDGLLRAVDGDRDGGEERWAFLPQEFYPHIKRLRDNSQEIFYPGLDIDGATRKNYGFDGPVVAYQAKATPNATQLNTAWIFASMRRGGHAIYAFDVIDPASPTLKWRKGCLKDPTTGVIGSCSTGMDDMGESWSSPTVVTATGYDGGASPLLLVGGGYDTCEDNFPHTCSSSSRGNVIYVLDADNGSVVKSFETERGVVAEITAITDSNDRLIYGYTADLGGNIYRISGPAGAPIGVTSPDSWVLTRVASLGCDTAEGTCENKNRKFQYAPDVVLTNNTYYLLVGSGDREKPLGESSSVSNYFFMVQDRPTDGNWLDGTTNGCDANTLCLDALLSIDTDATPSDDALAAKKGWYLHLNEGEQVVTSAITIFENVTFSTNEPTPPEPGECSNNLGTARAYNINYKSAAATYDNRSKELAGGGLPPSPFAGNVILDDGTIKPVIIGRGDCESAICAGEIEPPGVGTIPKTRIYWNLEE